MTTNVQIITLGALHVDMLKYIINIVLHNNIKTVRALAINKRIHALAYTLWPEIARSLLMFYPSSVNNVQKVFESMRSVNQKGYHIALFADSAHVIGDIVLHIEIVNRTTILIAVQKYAADFRINNNNIYKISYCYHRRIGANMQPQYVRYAHKTPPIRLRARIKYLLTKILPEIAPLFSFDANI